MAGAAVCGHPTPAEGNYLLRTGARDQNTAISWIDNWWCMLAPAKAVLPQFDLNYFDLDQSGGN